MNVDAHWSVVSQAGIYIYMYVLGRRQLVPEHSS